MGEKANSRITGGAGAVAALAAVSTVFAGAGLIGPGVGSLDPIGSTPGGWVRHHEQHPTSQVSGSAIS